VSGILPPLAALEYAARLLTAKGFVIATRNERGDAIYLRRPDSPWHLRLSNHARSAKQRRRRTDILTSLVVGTPRSPEQVAVLVRGALRDFEGNLRKRGEGDPSSEAGSIPSPRRRGED
jgi:hypothetical protein